MAFATIDDYAIRFGYPSDEVRVAANLEDAEAVIKAQVGHNIEATETTAIIATNGRRRLQLPGRPVTEVASVTLNDSALSASQYRWTDDGGLWRCGCEWPLHGSVVVEFTYGYEVGDLPAWLVRIECSLAHDMPDEVGGAVRSRSESIEGYSESVTYDVAAGSSRFSVDDLRLLEAITLPVAP